MPARDARGRNHPSDSETEVPFDLSAPDAVTRLLAYHRGTFGDAVMLADENPEPPEAPESAPAGQQQEQPKPAGDEPLGDSGKRALERERADRKAAQKTASELQAALDAANAKLTAREREDMSEQQRVAAERDDWRTRYETEQAARAELALTNLRMEVAISKGIPSHAHRLVGETREEIEADADAFKAELPTPQTPERVKYTDPAAGGTNTAGGRPGSVAEAMEAYRASRTRDNGDSK